MSELKRALSFEATDEQIDAIAHRDGAAIVSAAAGSGKTSVLVERVIQLLLDPDDPVRADEMIITTFTVKAAGEMKDRLLKALAKAAEAEPQNELIEEQMLRLNDASISTINSFCLSLLRRNAAGAGLTPGFAIADEAEAELYLLKALNLTVEEFCKKGRKKEKKLIYDCFSSENDEALCELLKKLYKFSRTLPDADKYFTKWEAVYAAGKYPRDLLDDYIERNICAPAARIVGLCDALDAKYGGTPASLTKMTQAFRAAANTLSGAKSHTCDHKKMLTAYKAVGKFPSSPPKSDKYDNSAAIAARKVMAGLWKDIGQPLFDVSRVDDDVQKSAPAFRILMRLVRTLDKKYTDIKRGKNKLDFEDVELLTLKMLRNDDGTPSAVAKETAASARIIIVDEFQDSNEIQYEIFRLISRDKSNLYFVGDIKQSIYAFRGADPSVFSSLTESGDYKVHDLNCNFRSCKQVIDAVNGTFMGLMTKELGGVDYDHTCALVQGAKYEDCGRKNVAELLPIYGDNADDAREREAAYIADRINHMVRRRFLVTERDNSRRPCRYGDFAILMGKYSTSAHIYKKAFRKAGLPLDAKEDESYTDFREVKLMLSLLRVIDNPYSSYDLATVMMCAPYFFTADEICAIKLAGGKKQKSLYTGLNAVKDTNEKARAFLDEINRYREFAAENTTEQLIRMLYDECPLIPAMKASPNGDRRDTNLKKLIGRASSFEKRSGGGLCDFLAYMEQLKSNKIKSKDSGAGASGGDYVKLMTIHNSKGLEFPVCFVANIFSGTKQRKYFKAECSRRYGIGLTVVEPKKLVEYNSLPYKLAISERFALEDSESMRLLYVALTRAKEKLILTAPLAGRISDNTHYSWIKDSAAVRNGQIKMYKPIYGYEAKNRAYSAQSGSGKCVLGSYSAYKDDRLCSVPAKVTATQIGVKSVDDFSDFNDEMHRFMAKPSFLETETLGKLSGKKLGDAYHKAMELLDFSDGAPCAKEQLDGLFTAGRLSSSERASISDEAIDAFLQADVCRRAARSGALDREYPIFCEFDTALFNIVPEDSILRNIAEDDDEKPIIQGVVDMFFTEEDGVVLVDYKTNRVSSEQQLIDEYRGQLAVYAYALTQMTGKKVKECYLYSFCLNKFIPVRV